MGRDESQDWLKYGSLLVLTVQNSAFILMLRYSRTMDGPRYQSSTAVVVSEVMKGVTSFLVALYTQRQSTKTVAGPSSLLDSPTAGPGDRHPPWAVVAVTRDLFARRNDFLLLMVPAVLYTIQSNLQYAAATNLDAATFQVTYQGKILTTAFFAVIILRQQLPPLRWLAIFILTIGVATIAFPTSSQQQISPGDRPLGLICVAAACMLSGFAGVYIEMVLKKVKESSAANGTSLFWIRNTQLALGSLFIAGAGVFILDGDLIRENGFFYGYNTVVWIAVFLQAFGGLVVAVVITHADNILKNFATSISVVISTAVAVAVGDSILTPNFLVGVVLVLAATHVYSMNGASPAKSAPRKEEWELVRDEESQDALEHQEKLHALGDSTNSAAPHTLHSLSKTEEPGAANRSPA